MSDPTRGNSGQRHRDNAKRRQSAMTAEDSLMVEAYGPKGAAMRKTLQTGTSVVRSDADSTAGQKVKARVKKLFGK